MATTLLALILFSAQQQQTTSTSTSNGQGWLARASQSAFMYGAEGRGRCPPAVESSAIASDGDAALLLPEEGGSLVHDKYRYVENRDDAST